MSNKNNFWFILLIVLLAVTVSTKNPNIFLRIALAANAVIVLLDEIKQVGGMLHGRSKKKN